MPRLSGESAERLADHFVNYLFEQYNGTRHVRRVASWVGLIMLGVEKVAAQDWQVPRSRQLEFNVGGLTFKAKYDHHAGARGGISIIEVLPGRGSPEGDTVVTITNLDEAGAFYDDAEQAFRAFLARRRGAAPVRA